MEWLKRLGAAIDYIEENLDREISYDEVARIACCSTYYFQRIFSYVSGVSLSEYIRRRKMTQFIPFSGYEYAGLPDVEIYPVCKGQPSKGHSEVWIAIKKAKEI